MGVPFSSIHEGVAAVPLRSFRTGHTRKRVAFVVAWGGGCTARQAVGRGGFSSLSPDDLQTLIPFCL